ncbi:MAG: hypothetical protein ABMB14_34020, partial [Myxococcota bacterium]
MSMVVCSLIAATATAGVSVAFPSSERSGDWSDVLALGDLQWSDADPDVVIVASGSSWTIRASGRLATVPVPATRDEREDVVWLVVSLVTPVEAPPPVEPVAPPPVAPAPS